jgi:hypothetical protein
MTDVLSELDEQFRESMRVAGVPVIFCKHVPAGEVWREPFLSKPNRPVFMCRSAEDLLAAIDGEFWRAMGIEDPRL